MVGEEEGVRRRDCFVRLASEQNSFSQPSLYSSQLLFGLKFGYTDALATRARKAFEVFSIFFRNHLRTSQVLYFHTPLPFSHNAIRRLPAGPQSAD